MSLKERIKKADQIYQIQLKEKLEKDHRGEIVAIEIASGDFFLGKNEIDAYEEAVKKYPDKTFVYKRIGYQEKIYQPISNIAVKFSLQSLKSGQLCVLI